MERLHDTREYIYPNGLTYYRPWRERYIFRHNLNEERHLANMAIYNYNQQQKKEREHLEKQKQTKQLTLFEI